MIDKLKKEALKRGMKLMSNPKFMRAMADPRVMTAISQGFALHGRIQSEVDERLRKVAHMFNFATAEEVQELKRTIRQMETAISRAEQDKQGR